MKNIFTLIHFCFLSLSAFSQTEKGSFLLGGTGIVYFPTKATHTFSIYLAPKAGYFLFKNFAIGITPTSSYSLSLYSGGYKSTYTRLSAGSFIRYYVGKSKLRCFAEAGINYLHGWDSYKSLNGRRPDSYFEMNYLNENLGIGMVYFINEHIGLEANFQYLQYQHQFSRAVGNSHFYNWSNNYTLNFGFQIYIPAKKKESVEQK
jgi:hypothetical protein